jgi:IS5 family transposase
MRQERTVQASIFDSFAEHEIGREPRRCRRGWMTTASCAAWSRRTCAGKGSRRRAEGLPAESVLRCAVLKQYRQLSYQKLEFHLEDWGSFRAFARLPWSWSPRKSVLHQTISAIRAATWEAIKRALLASAAKARWSAAGWCGRTTRSPRRCCTGRATAAAVGCGSGDGASVEGGEGVGAGGPLAWRDHQRAAKKRARDNEMSASMPAQKLRSLR